MNNLPVIKKKSFFEEIKKSIKRLFRIKTEENKQQEEKLNIELVNEKKFINNIKIEEDLSKKKLLEIQRKLEEGGITEELVTVLTKDLTNEERISLLKLYVSVSNSRSVLLVSLRILASISVTLSSNSE